MNFQIRKLTLTHTPQTAPTYSVDSPVMSAIQFMSYAIAVLNFNIQNSRGWALQNSHRSTLMNWMKNYIRSVTTLYLPSHHYHQREMSQFSPFHRLKLDATATRRKTGKINYEEDVCVIFH